MKKMFLVIIIGMISVISCKIVDPPLSCRNVFFYINVMDSVRSVDITGDSISLPLIRYNKDSIRYQIISPYDTTEKNIPDIVNTGLYNQYTFNFNFGMQYGLYKVLFILNRVETDTLNINIIDSYNIRYYNKGSLIKSEKSDCGILEFTFLK